MSDIFAKDRRTLCQRLVLVLGVDLQAPSTRGQWQLSMF